MSEVVEEKEKPHFLSSAYVEKLKETNNKRLSLSMPHSGQKPKNENDPKEEDDLQWKMTFD